MTESTFSLKNTGRSNVVRLRTTHGETTTAATAIVSTMCRARIARPTTCRIAIVPAVMTRSKIVTSDRVNIATPAPTPNATARAAPGLSMYATTARRNIAVVSTTRLSDITTASGIQSAG